MGWFDNVTKWLDDSDDWVWKNTYERLPKWWKDSDKQFAEDHRTYKQGTPPDYDTGGAIGKAASNFAQNQPPPANTPTNTSGLTLEQAQAILEEMRKGGSTDGGSGSGYNMRAVMDQINQSFDRQQQNLDAAKGAGASGIQNAYNQFSSNIGRDYADYTGAAQQAQAAMAARVAQQIADAQARQGQLQASSQSMGQDIGALTQQQAGNLDALRTSSGFQQDLSQRMAQIVANNQRAMEGSGELVRQGASGNLEANYLSLLGALQSGREQSLLSAQTGGSGGGGGGGSTKSPSAKDAYDELNYTQKGLDLLLGGGDSGGDFAGVSRDKLADIWWAAKQQTDDPIQQGIADQIAPYLATKD
jgi:hypothetical protein